MHLRLLPPNYVEVEAGEKGKGMTNHWNRSKIDDQTIKLVLEGHVEAVEDKSRFVARQNRTEGQGNDG